MHDPPMHGPPADQLEVADELGHPSLFSGFNTFKRPPFAELELFRVRQLRHQFDTILDHFGPFGTIWDHL